MVTVALCDLTDELLVLIFKNLDGRDLISCSRVCRQFHLTIRDAIILQYIIELSIAGLSDRGSASPLAIVDRLSELKAFQQSRATLSFRKRITQPLHPSNVWELFGGFFARGIVTDGTRGLAFVELPSAVRDTPVKTWEHPDMGVAIRDFTIDPTQDLAVLIEHPTEDKYAIHMKSMKTGKPHPRAADAVLSCVPESTRVGDFVIQVMDEFLAVLFHNPDRTRINQLYIWNWRTGRCVTELQASQTTTIIDSFSFLSPRHFVVSRFESDYLQAVTPALDVYDFLTPDPFKHPTSLAPRLVRSFEFPPISPNRPIITMLTRSDPPPQGGALPSDSQASFRTANKSRVLAVSLEIIKNQRQINAYVLFVHHSTLLDGIEEGEIPDALSVQVPWENWGREKSRLLQMLFNEHTWVCYIHGTQYVRLEPSRRELGIRLLDFNPLNLHREYAGKDEDNDDNAERKIDASQHYVHTALDDTCIPLGEIFEHEVVTSLPYRETLSNENFGYDAIMIDEECLVGLFPGETGGMEGLEFLCF